jgi:hypothetical protein
MEWRRRDRPFFRRAISRVARLSAPITRFRLLGVKVRLDSSNFCVT